MSIESFTIGSLQFVDLETDPRLSARTSTFVNQLLHKVARERFRTNDVPYCKRKPGDVYYRFAMLELRGAFVGGWTFYDVTPIGRNGDFEAAYLPALPEIADDDPDWTRFGEIHAYFIANAMVTDRGQRLQLVGRKESRPQDKGSEWWGVRGSGATDATSSRRSA